MPTTRAGPGCRHPLLHTLRCLAASPAVWDITAILRQTPEDPHWGPAGASHYWAEPELGYDLLRDEHVIRKHCEMLTDAGIDVLIFDAGNGRTQATNYLALCRVFRHVRDGGGMTPQIAFMANPDVVREVHFEFYSQDLYPELWFRWLGKPLILSTSADPDTYEEPYRSFFTIRRCWDSTYGKDAWSWIAWHPQGHGWHETEGEVEQMSASFARHPTASVGRSYSNGKQPPIDRDALTGLEHLGIYFDEQMSRVHEMDPKFPLICQWNEWTAGRHVSAEAHGEGMFGRPAQPGGTYFVDEYNMEFSRDAEPMKGGFGDSYYHQLTSAVRRFKGVRAPDPVSPPQEIAIDGRFGEWADVKPEYRDHIGDTQHRLAQGYARGLFYTNTTGRNDLVAMKVARDDSNVYFYARTEHDLTPATDPIWMLLFIDGGQDPQTGWHGYDYLVNRHVADATTTSLERTGAGWEWESLSRDISHAVSGNELELSVPRDMLGEDGPDVSIDFHWADNIEGKSDIAEFALHGDSAPSRRFNHRYGSPDAGT